MENRQLNFFQETSPNGYEKRRPCVDVASATDDKFSVFQCILGNCARTSREMNVYAWTCIMCRRWLAETVLVTQPCLWKHLEIVTVHNSNVLSMSAPWILFVLQALDVWSRTWIFLHKAKLDYFSYLLHTIHSWYEFFNVIQRKQHDWLIVI